MRAIDEHPVRFGELAGPLVHGAKFFDWQLISTQELAHAVEYPFEDLVAEDAIPYAPVKVDTTVHRYPTFDDVISTEVTPTHVGDSSVELVYEVVDSDGDPVSTAQMTHVTIAPEGGALPFPQAVQSRLEDRRENVDVNLSLQDESSGEYPTFNQSYSVNSPHIEGAELAYFEEYPRFADLALESFLADSGCQLSELAGDRQPFRLRDWHWEFKSPVHFDSILDVTSDIKSVSTERIQIAHTFRTDGEIRIQGTSEYGCFDRGGNPTTFTTEMTNPFER
ncbi:acyl-CoA thioesterase [Halobacterium noricense]|uniref:acyl-CoA thioesterase n=1 Tax=Halobacterium noricense TaxID=223182 RepID=UPI001E486D83|nr:acyl-[acyl-carrier-protein] thioesterase [Halobacterium noricense]UHH23969.1 acyl-[acyl-carrier-protein] thioesterase [Halobacterium noricense]